MHPLCEAKHDESDDSGLPALQVRRLTKHHFSYFSILLTTSRLPPSRSIQKVFVFYAYLLPYRLIHDDFVRIDRPQRP